MYEQRPTRIDGEETEKTEEEHEEEERARLQRAAQRGYLRNLYPPHQARVAFERAGLDIPRELLEMIIDFEVDDRRGFFFILRHPMTLSPEAGGLRFAQTVRGRIVNDRAERLEGVSFGGEEVRCIDRTMKGVEAVVTSGKRMDLPGWLQ